MGIRQEAFPLIVDVPRTMDVTTRPPNLMASQYEAPAVPRSCTGEISAKKVGITASCIPRYTSTAERRFWSAPCLLFA